MEKLKNNNSERFNNDNEIGIIEMVKKIILSHHPIVENRINDLFGKSEFDISLNMYDCDGKKYSTICFIDGFEYARNSIYESIVLNGTFSIRLVNELISYILTDHDVIGEFWKNSETIDMKFRVNLNQDNLKGISCRTIGLSINFYGMASMSAYLDLYFKDIVSVFFDKLKDTPFMQRELEDYVTKIKEQFLDETSKEVILELLSKLSIEDLKRIIEDMDMSTFMHIMQSKETEETYSYEIKNLTAGL